MELALNLNFTNEVQYDNAKITSNWSKSQQTRFLQMNVYKYMG